MNTKQRPLSRISMAVLFFLFCMLPLAAQGAPETPVVGNTPDTAEEHIVNTPVENTVEPVLKGEPISCVAAIESITALVAIDNNGGVMLVQNAGSKSRITYTVVGDMAHVLYNFRDETIDADVIFLEKKRWSGSLVVVSIRLPDSEEIQLHK